MKNPFKISKQQDKNCIYWEWNIPFTNQDKWVEWSLYKNIWFEIEVKELYTPEEEHQAVLGSSDSRLIFCLGFRVPFRKETYND